MKRSRSASLERMRKRRSGHMVDGGKSMTPIRVYNGMRDYFHAPGPRFSDLPSADEQDIQNLPDLRSGFENSEQLHSLAQGPKGKDPAAAFVRQNDNNQHPKGKNVILSESLSSSNSLVEVTNERNPGKEKFVETFLSTEDSSSEEKPSGEGFSGVTSLGKAFSGLKSSAKTLSDPEPGKNLPFSHRNSFLSSQRTTKKVLPKGTRRIPKHVDIHAAQELDGQAPFRNPSKSSQDPIRTSKMLRSAERTRSSRRAFDYTRVKRAIPRSPIKYNNFRDARASVHIPNLNRRTGRLITGELPEDSGFAEAPGPTHLDPVLPGDVPPDADNSPEHMRTSWRNCRCYGCIRTRRYWGYIDDDCRDSRMEEVLWK